MAILPGRDFGRPAEELTARLAYVNFDGGRALEAAAEIAADQELDDGFLRSWCGETLTAVERIGEWLNC